jgi:hypothetical protein
MGVILTKAADAGRPPQPITLNPDHVVSLEPSFQPKPNLGSQAGGILPAYSGTKLQLATGERIRLLEDYPTAHAKLWPAVADSAKPLVDRAAALLAEYPNDEVRKVIAQLAEATLGSVAGTAIVHKHEDAEPEKIIPAPLPTKKAPAKKAIHQEADSPDVEVPMPDADTNDIS